MSERVRSTKKKLPILPQAPINLDFEPFAYFTEKGLTFEKQILNLPCGRLSIFNASEFSVNRTNLYQAFNYFYHFSQRRIKYRPITEGPIYIVSPTVRKNGQNRSLYVVPSKVGIPFKDKLFSGARAHTEEDGSVSVITVVDETRMEKVNSIQRYAEWKMSVQEYTNEAFYVEICQMMIDFAALALNDLTQPLDYAQSLLVQEGAANTFGSTYRLKSKFPDAKGDYLKHFYTDLSSFFLGFKNIASLPLTQSQYASFPAKPILFAS